MLLLGFAMYQDIILRSKLGNSMHVCLHVNTYICADFMHMSVSVVECVCLCQVLKKCQSLSTYTQHFDKTQP